MATKVEIPSMGESVTEATIVRWIKSDGEAVNVDDPLCELETDKANVELPSPAKGFVKQLKAVGDVVRIGEVVAEVSAEATNTTTAATPKAPTKAAAEAPANETRPASSDLLSPSVRRAIKETGVDPATVHGTGPRGRIVKEDVLHAAEEKVAAKPAPAAAKPASPPAPSFVPKAPSVPGQGERRVPMTKIRKKIAERLVSAKRDTAMLTTFNEVDMTEVMGLREKYKARFTETYGVPLGLMSFFARACVVALHEFQGINAFVDGDDVIYHDDVHLGIAVSTERGLVVPVLKRVGTMSFAKIESEIKRMATAARDGKLGLDELGGGTFTITNGGVFGSLLSTPILNPPQSGILGLHAIQKRPVVVNDQVVIRPMMYLALSYDHRIVDGKESVSFLVRVKNLLEDPSRLMLEV